MTHHSVYYIMNNEGDWCGLYANGELVHEGHSIPPFEWMNLINELGHQTTSVYDDGYMLGEGLDAVGGRYPQELDKLIEIIGDQE